MGISAQGMLLCVGMCLSAQCRSRAEAKKHVRNLRILNDVLQRQYAFVLESIKQSSFALFLFIGKEKIIKNNILLYRIINYTEGGKIRVKSDRRNVLRFIGDTFLNKQLDFRVRLYNVLAMSGVPIGLAMAVSCIFTNAGIGNTLVNLMIATGSFILLYYSYKSGKYQRCYTLSIVIMFFIFWSALFFTAGGYHSGMPSFFVFAVLFTVFMLEGWKMIAMTVLEIAFYVGICLVAYFYPETVRNFQSEQDVMSDIIIGFVTVSIGLGITMFLHFRIYNQQQRELEAAREEAVHLSKAKSSFLANMSHEIRTPINVMLGMNEMILRESDSAQVREYGQNLETAGKSLLLLINNILDISKIESGVLPVMDEPYQIADLIDGLVMTGTELAGKYGLQFKTEIDETLPLALTGDILHVRQIASNFLSNAAKYTEEGIITLSFRQKPCTDSSSAELEILLCVSVSDTGIGIKEENIPYLFDAFTRADLLSNRNIEGTGLGLAIAKELAMLMGGYIHVESQWGKGSVFSVEIPQKVSDATHIGECCKSERTEKIQRNGFIAPGGSVLVVDDNKENLQVTKVLLSRTMLRVDTAASGSECLESVKKFHYNVILLDYMMPDMDGLETLKHLKEQPGFDTPVVALTANVVAGTKQRLLEAGFIQYLSKPVVWADLETALYSLLPSELIMKKTYTSALLLPETADKLTWGLLAKGIVLENGLRYLSGDAALYGKMAVLFTENYESGKSEITEFAVREDWVALKLCVHSLKSKALAVGANRLSDTAAKLEELCEAGDGKYIATMMPVLCHEWECAVQGLSAFKARLDDDLSEKPKTEVSYGYDELLALLKHNRYPSSIDMLDRLISETDRDTAAVLCEIRQQVDDIEFREAERLLRTFMEDIKNGN